MWQYFCEKVPHSEFDLPTRVFGVHQQVGQIWNPIVMSHRVGYVVKRRNQCDMSVMCQTCVWEGQNGLFTALFEKKLCCYSTNFYENHCLLDSYHLC